MGGPRQDLLGLPFLLLFRGFVCVGSCLKEPQSKSMTVAEAEGGPLWPDTARRQDALTLDPFHSGDPWPSPCSLGGAGELGLRSATRGSHPTLSFSQDERSFVGPASRLESQSVLSCVVYRNLSVEKLIRPSCFSNVCFPLKWWLTHFYDNWKVGWWLMGFILSAPTLFFSLRDKWCDPLF